MNSLIADSEFPIRLSLFLLLFITLALLEHFYPRRQLNYAKPRRWVTNFLISIINVGLVRILMPIAGVAASAIASENNWGILNNVHFPRWLEIVTFLIAFDLTIYFQHRLFHRVPLLWRLHRVHHTDLDYDVTTGNRFHPLSILISAIIKLALILITGPLPIAVIIAEVLLNATSMFNHSNLKMPKKLDSLMRQLIVTPDMHRVHHSTQPQEHNRNFGFNLSLWDRLFGTYCERPQAGHARMAIGIDGFQSDNSIKLYPLLTQPLEK